MDDADRAGPGILATIDAGIARVRLEAERSLKPIIQVKEGTNKRVGMCHQCESEITAGRLFCSKDCSDDHEHERVRMKALGL